MTELKLNSQVAELISTPLLELEALSEKDTYSPHGANLASQHTAVELIRRATYMEAKHAGKNHASAVKYSNDAVMRVRRALGYTQHRNDFSF